MSSVPSLGPVGQSGQQTTTGHDAFQEVDMDDFLRMMIAELQHQDPLNPMDNAQILQQISQIREIESNDKLTTTLEGILLGQNVATAAGMIGQWVATDLDGDNPAAGRVDRVGIDGGKRMAYIDGRPLAMADVAHIVPEELGQQLAEAMTMIGRRVQVDEGSVPTGLSPIGHVRKISIVDQTARLHIGDQLRDFYTVAPEEIRKVLADE